MGNMPTLLLLRAPASLSDSIFLPLDHLLGSLVSLLFVIYIGTYICTSFIGKRAVTKWEVNIKIKGESEKGRRGGKVKSNGVPDLGMDLDSIFPFPFPPFYFLLIFLISFFEMIFMALSSLLLAPPD